MLFLILREPQSGHLDYFASSLFFSVLLKETLGSYYLLASVDNFHLSSTESLTLAALYNCYLFIYWFVDVELLI